MVVSETVRVRDICCLFVCLFFEGGKEMYKEEVRQQEMCYSFFFFLLVCIAGPFSCSNEN